MTLVVRPGRPADFPAMLAVARSLGEWFNAAGLARMERDLLVQTGYVASLPSLDLAGFVTLAPSPEGGLEIAWLAVDLACHGRGVGRALVGAAAGHARATGAPRLLVSTLAHTVEYAPYGPGGVALAGPGALCPRGTVRRGQQARS